MAFFWAALSAKISALRCTAISWDAGTARVLRRSTRGQCFPALLAARLPIGRISLVGSTTPLTSRTDHPTRRSAEVLGPSKPCTTATVSTLLPSRRRTRRSRSAEASVSSAGGPPLALLLHTNETTANVDGRGDVLEDSGGVGAHHRSVHRVTTGKTESPSGILRHGK